MRWDLDTCVVRDLEPGDAADLACHADNRKVWLNLRDRMPHPYGEADAAAYIKAAAAMDPSTVFGIEVAGETAGSVGFTLHGDIDRCGGEIGYWLGEAYWGRGVITEILRILTPWALDAYSLCRVFAIPFADNAASCRVLVKAGYALEGTMRRSAIKAGVVRDQRLYAFVREPADDPAGFLGRHGP